MKKTKLYISRPGAENKKDVLFEEIQSLCPDSNDYSRVLYLGPNSYVISSVRGRFFSYLKNSGNTTAYVPFRTKTIKQLAVDLHSRYGEGRLISDRIRGLMFCEILKDRNIGYAKLLSGMYKRVRHYVTDRGLLELKDEIGKLIFEEKARDRAVRAIELLEEYDAELKQKNLVDPDGLLHQSIELIKRSMPGDQRTALIIDGFFDPSPLELDVLDALAARSESVSVIAEENTEIHKHFKAKGNDVSIERVPPVSKRTGSGYYTYPSIEDEVEGIAKEIRRLIFTGTAPRDITVCFPVLSRYLPMVQRVFGKYTIPVSIAGSDISASGPFVVLAEMITCMEDDYPRSDLLSVLTSPYFPLIPEIVKKRAVAYAYRAGIVKGRQAWQSIQGVLMKASGPGEGSEMLNGFQEGLDSVINVIEGLKHEKDLPSFVSSFEKALSMFGFFGMNETGHARKVVRQLGELKLFGGIYENGLNNFDMPGFYLRQVLKDVSGSNENRDGVQVLPFELAAETVTKELFFGGILEGDFPSKPGIDPILPEKVKKALGIPHVEYYLKRQRLYFGRLLNSSEHVPYFSCPSAEGDKMFLPSPFLDWGALMKPAIPDIFSEEEALLSKGASGRLEAFVSQSNGTGSSKKKAGLGHGRSISVTDIDYYRKCPFRFYIEKVLRLEIEEPPRFEVESRLWGSLAHKTMEYLFLDGIPEMAVFEQKLFKGLEKSIKDFPIGEFWSGVAKEIFTKLLPMLKAQEDEVRDQGYVPEKIEEKVFLHINEVKVRGKIDRIDVQRSAVSGPASAAVLDYKTGTIDSYSLQLPLYAAMCRETLDMPVEKAGYYSLKDGRITWYPKKKDIDEYMQDALQAAEVILEKIKSGDFPAEPFNVNECRYCGHGGLCNR